MKDAIQIINACFSIAAGSFTFLAFVSKKFRTFMFQRKTSEEDRLETERCILRTLIMDTYYRYRTVSEIPQIVFENTGKLYAQYKKLKGNSFIDRIWHEMQEWMILP